MHQCFSSQFRMDQDSEIVTVSGCPSGIELDEADVLVALKRFFLSYNQNAAEKMNCDQIDFLEGVSGNKTTGQDIKLSFQDCADTQNEYIRQAVAHIMAGVVAQKYLGGPIRLRGALVQLGEHIVDRTDWNWAETEKNTLFSPNAKATEFWQHFLDQVASAGQSVGSVIELQAHGIPAGWSGGSCGALDGEIARALMSIVGAKGVEVGAGFALAALTGAMSQDQQKKTADGVVSFKSNKAGGIVDGVSTGQDIIVRVAVQPTLLAVGDATPVHPCLGISAVPVGEAMLACVLAGAKLQNESQEDLAAAC